MIQTFPLQDTTTIVCQAPGLLHRHHTIMSVENRVLHHEHQGMRRCSRYISDNLQV